MKKQAKSIRACLNVTGLYEMGFDWNEKSLLKKWEPTGMNKHGIDYRMSVQLYHEISCGKFWFILRINKFLNIYLKSNYHVKQHIN